jgi:hypothetical protein
MVMEQVTEYNNVTREVKLQVRILRVDLFLFIKNKELFISSEGFSAVEKNTVIGSQRAMLPIQLGVTARYR